VALAIDPGFEPDDPLLRAPRVLALFRDMNAEASTGGAPRGVFPVLPVRGDGREVRLTVRVQGVHPPLKLTLRHRARGPAGPGDWRERALVAVDGAPGTFGVTIHPPAEATSTETEFLVQTPDRVPILRVAGPNLTRESPRSAPPAPRRALPRTLAAPSPLAPTAVPPVDGDSSAVWLWSTVGAVGLLAVVITALVAAGEIEPLFRIQL
jgi:hypothetical protein